MPYGTRHALTQTIPHGSQQLQTPECLSIVRYYIRTYIMDDKGPPSRGCHK